MSPPWSKPLEIDRLVETKADIDFVVPLAELLRLRSQLASVGGSVRGHVHFAREVGIGVAELALSGTVTLVCQRCLEIMELRVESTVRVGLIEAVADMNRMPEDLEPMLAPEGRISIGELVEEELLLALPIVPLHESAAGCAVALSTPAVTEEQEERKTQKPFERLGELLKRSPS
jgi:uncharacterized protein